MPSEDSNRLATLLGRALAGDTEALNALLEKIRPYLRLLVRQRRRSDRGHKLDDSDQVQETLMRIHHGLDAARPDDLAHFRGEGIPQLLGWVRTIVGHVVDGVRHDRAERRDGDREVPGSTVLAILTRESSPERRAERTEQAVLLAAALERLPEHQRAVLHWRFFDQLSFGEIAARTGKSVGALRVVRSRALDSLAQDERLRREMEASR